MDTNSFRARQGDVMLVKIKTLPQGVKPLKDKTLAYGEITGHSHRFVDDKHINRYELDGKLYLEVLQATELTHEEHHNWKMLSDGAYVPYSGMILPGVYEQVREKEHDYIEESAKVVVD